MLVFKYTKSHTSQTRVLHHGLKCPVSNPDFTPVSFVHSCGWLSEPHGLAPAGLLCPWDFLGKSTGIVAISYSRGSSQPSNQTCICCRIPSF